MTDEKQPPRKSIADRAKDLVQDILEALADLLPEPQPELVPIPIDRHRRRR